MPNKLTNESQERRKTMANPEGKSEFVNLWPTLFMSVLLPGHEQANGLLSSLVMQQNAEQNQMTTNYLEQNIFSVEHPAIIWLRQSCEHGIKEYSSHAGLETTPEYSLQGWPNVNFKGDYHNLHNHPHSWLSGTYYLHVPSQEKAETYREDLNPAEISFFDPRASANMTAIRNDGQFDPEYRRQPNAGELFLWPSFLYHFVHPNLVDEPRLSISFNVILHNKSKYL
jgi:uncharacterized protein (TIGR02466 family)